MRRVGYALLMAYRYRRELSGVLERAPSCRHVWEICPESLAEPGVSVLVLDFDGVLAPHGEDAPLPEMVEWLDGCVRQFGAERVFLLTNGPSAERRSFFQRCFPGIRIMDGVRKKPYPDGLQAIANLTGVSSDALMLVDDRLTTGVLAACLAGARVTYVTCPFVRIWKRPVRESFFAVLRHLERTALRGLAHLDRLISRLALDRENATKRENRLTRHE